MTELDAARLPCIYCCNLNLATMLSPYQSSLPYVILCSISRITLANLWCKSSIYHLMSVTESVLGIWSHQRYFSLDTLSLLQGCGPRLSKALLPEPYFRRCCRMRRELNHKLHNKRWSAEPEDIFIDGEYIGMKDEVNFHICQQFAACDHFSTCILSMFYVVSILVLEVAVLLVSSGEVIQKLGNCRSFQ